MGRMSKSMRFSEPRPSEVDSGRRLSLQDLLVSKRFAGFTTKTSKIFGPGLGTGKSSGRVSAEELYDAAHQDVLEQEYPMHCISVHDLMSFEFLPSHDDIANQGKFVIADEKEERNVVFVSHQWALRKN